MSFDMEITAICLTSILLGMAIQSLARSIKEEIRMRRRAGRVSRPYEGPAPADLGYDPMNPMNAGRTPETVEICGATWYKMG